MDARGRQSANSCFLILSPECVKDHLQQHAAALDVSHDSLIGLASSGIHKQQELTIPSRDLDHGELGRVGAGHEGRGEQREEAEEDRRGEHVVEPGRQDPPPRDEAEHWVVLGELLEVVARRLSLVDHRACGSCRIGNASTRKSAGLQEGIREA